MAQIEMIAVTLFGLEAIAADEIRNLGCDVTSVEDGKVTFTGDEYDLCRVNLWVRTAERILVKIGEFQALTYDELFENTKKLDWGAWIPENAAFPVKGYSLKSRLFSVPDCQAIVKKAVVEKLKQKYSKEWFDEKGAMYRIQFSLMKDKATLMLDTSGEGLHKRGYRENANEAPLRETLAAALVILSRWRPAGLHAGNSVSNQAGGTADKPASRPDTADGSAGVQESRALMDPFCGSGTILIEAALLGTNTAPGLERNFAAEQWDRVPKELWWKARKEAHEAINRDVEFRLLGSDIDDKALAVARENASLAGVEEFVSFQKLDAREIRSRKKYGYIITNPPYGERLGEKNQVERLYQDMGKTFADFETWSFFIITSHEEFEKFYGRKASKKRKLYNGMIRCNLYQYYGPRPPRETKDRIEPVAAFTEKQ